MKAYAPGQKPSRKAAPARTRLLGRDVPVVEYSVLLAGHFDKDSSYCCWRSRGSRDWLLFFTLHGAGRIADRNGYRLTVPGDVVLCPPGRIHDYRTDAETGQWQFLWAHFHPQAEWLGWLSQLPEWGCGWLGFALPDDERPRVRARLEEMHEFITRGGPLESRLALNALEEVILRAALHARRPSVNGDRRIESALAFVAQHYCRPLTLTEIATASQQSVSRLKQVFRQHVGLTVGAYLEKRRMSRAAELLRHTSLTVKEIASEVGFGSPFHFSTRFARMFGKSPRAYRQAANDSGNG